MSIQEMAVENAEKRLKEIDKLDFAVSAWADYDNGLTQGFKDGAEAMLEKACEWLKSNLGNPKEMHPIFVNHLIENFRKAMEEVKYEQRKKREK